MEISKFFDVQCCDVRFLKSKYIKEIYNLFTHNIIDIIKVANIKLNKKLCENRDIIIVSYGEYN